MLGSADILNTLTLAIDQLPKRTDDGYECKSWATAYVEFHLNSTIVFGRAYVLLEFIYLFHLA